MGGSNPRRGLDKNAGSIFERTLVRPEGQNTGCIL